MYETKDFESVNFKQTREVSFVIQFSAVTVAVTALLIGIPSVEIISLSIFFAGFIFRFRFSVKLLLAITLSWEVVATMVFGFSGYIFPFKILGWFVVLFLGRASRSLNLEKAWEFAIMGGFSALVWDLVVLLALPLTLGNSENFVPLLFSSFVFGIPFTVIHVVSNTYLFSLIPVITKSLVPHLSEGYPELLLEGAK